jgi:hypothetical protein
LFARRARFRCRHGYGFADCTGFATAHRIDFIKISSELRQSDAAKAKRLAL